MKHSNQQPTYEKPTIEIITFELNDSIASSMDHGPNLSCGENIFGMGSED